MSYTCPLCGMVSHHPKDEEHGYCGNCHSFTGDAIPLGYVLVTGGLIVKKSGGWFFEPVPIGKKRDISGPWKTIQGAWHASREEFHLAHECEK